MSEGKLVICCAGGADGVAGAFAVERERCGDCGDCVEIMTLLELIDMSPRLFIRVVVEIVVSVRGNDADADARRRPAAVEEVECRATFVVSL